ncbi:MAG TPA: 2OG-Fe(II) oxygenase [Nannocystis sp.]
MDRAEHTAGEARPPWPGDLSRWLFHYHRHMVAVPLRRAAPLRPVDPDDDFTIGEAFVRDFVHTWAPDILSFPLLSPRFCQFLIDASDALGTWEPAEGDPYGAPEMRLDRITPRLSTVVKTIVTLHVNPLFRRVFMGAYTARAIETPFLIRYDMAAQQDMGLHMDGQSEVSLAIWLNHDYEGGGLRFPRQNCVVRQLPVGHALMFLGGPTHMHEARPITAGVRRTLTIWTRSAEAPRR